LLGGILDVLEAKWPMPDSPTASAMEAVADADNMVFASADESGLFTEVAGSCMMMTQIMVVASQKERHTTGAKSWAMHCISSGAVERVGMRALALFSALKDPKSASQDVAMAVAFFQLLCTVLVFVFEHKSSAPRCWIPHACWLEASMRAINGIALNSATHR
jgi:hypothetical protein